MRPRQTVLILAALSATALASPALAQNSGRFTFQPMEGGLLRLDTETGQVSHCTRAGDSFACRSVADDRAAMQDEIDRLRRENDQLRQAAGNPGVTGKIPLPSEEEIDKAMGMFEKLMRRMMRSFRDDGAAPDKL
jgi:hypothetical protein